MARVRLGASGFVIAKPGFDTDAAEKNLLFSPHGGAARVFMNATVAIPSATQHLGVSSSYDDRYHKATVSFGKTFVRPPICFVGYRWDSGSNGTGNNLYGGPNYAYFGGTAGSSRYEPILFGVASNTQLDIWSLRYGSGFFLFHLLVLENLTP